jgi:hypothetical protein
LGGDLSERVAERPRGGQEGRKRGRRRLLGVVMEMCRRPVDGGRKKVTVVVVWCELLPFSCSLFVILKIYKGKKKKKKKKKMDRMRLVVCFVGPNPGLFYLVVVVVDVRCEVVVVAVVVDVQVRKWSGGDEKYLFSRVHTAVVRVVCVCGVCVCSVCV